MAKYFHKVEVKNGTSTSFWFDNWCDMGRLIDITGQRGTIDLGIPLNGSIAQGKHSRRQRRHRSQILQQIENSLSSLQITDSADIHQWRHSETTFKTKFFTKITWRLIRQSSPQVNWYKGLWFPKATPKYAFVSWLAINNRLSTGKRMKKWNTRINLECSLCKASEEDRAHLFFACSYSTKVWQKLARGVLGAAYTNQWERLQFIVNDSIIPKLKLFLLRYLLQVTVYFLWRERNSRRHGEPETPAETMIKLIDKQVRAFIASLHHDGVTYDGARQLWFYLQGY